MNILIELRNKYGEDIKKGLINQQNISEKDANAAMDIALPTLMASVIRKVGTDRGTNYLQDLVDQEIYDGSLLNKLKDPNPKAVLKKEIEQGEKLLPVLLGSSIIKENILNISGKITGLGYQSVKSTFAFLAPIVLNFVGKKVREKNLDKNNLVKLLKGQKGLVKQEVHPDISRELGLRTWRLEDVEEEPLVFPEEEPVIEEEVIVEKQKSTASAKWFIWPLLLLGVLALLIFGILKGFNSDSQFAEKMDKNMPVKKSTKKENSTKNSVLTKPKPRENSQPRSFENTKPNTPKTPIKKDPVVKKPPVIEIEKPKTEEKPITNEPEVEKKEPEPKKVNYSGPLALLDMVANRKVASVIDFGNINTDSNELTSNGKNTLQQVADIMKANPNLNITIRGHHKKHTSSEENFNADSSAASKANTAKAFLETQGISSSRVKSVSVGYNEPVNAQDPGNARNNRISIKTK